MGDLHDKIVIITGAGSGIGRHLAIALAERSAMCILTDLNEKTISETVQLILRNGGRAKGYAYDISIEEDMQGFATEVLKDFGTCHILINNAGSSIRRNNFLDVDPENFDWMIKVNMWGAIYCTRAFLPMMMQQNNGQIVNVCSIYSMLGVSHRIAYCTAKFGLRGFSETLRQELRGTGIGVTTVLPGGVKTNITKNSRGWENKDTHRITTEVSERLAMSTPESAAKKIIRGALRNKARVLIGKDAWVLDWVARLFPSGYHYLVSFFLKKIEKKIRKEYTENQKLNLF